MIEVPSPPESISDAKPASKSPPYLLLFLVTIVIGCGLWAFGSELTLEGLASREATFQYYRSAHPLLVYLLAVGIYVTVTGLSLPGATAMTLVIGWLFGFWRGVLMVSFASTLGATLAFLLSRTLFRNAMTTRFGDRLPGFNKALAAEGAFYLFSMRLVPAVPFFVVNAIMGLTAIRVRTFWWVSQLGMLPGTLVYVYAGSRVPNLKSLAEKGVSAVFSPGQMAQIVTAFMMLGLFPLVIRRVLKNRTTTKPDGEYITTTESQRHDSHNSTHSR